MGKADALAAKVTNTILGGGTFRLFNNLREKHGYTYGAYSSLESNRIIGSFMANANVRNTVTDSSVTEFLAEMKRLSDEPVGEAELTKVKNYMTGGFAISLENPQTIANFAINTARYNLAKDYYKNYLKNLAAVSAADVQKMAKKYILPEQSYIVAVGKAADIADNLKKFSVSGKVDFYDADGNKVDPTAAKAPEGVTVEKVIDDYITAVGGKENLYKVKDRTTVSTGTIQGMQLSSTVYQKAPNKFLAKISVSGMEQVVLFDGVKGEQRSVMGNNEMTGAELEEIAFISDFTAMTRLKDFGVTAKLTGMQKINGKDAYRIELKLPKGSTLVEFYDAESHLKVRQERSLSTPNGTFTQQTDYLDYKDNNGVKYAFTMVQSVAGRSIELKTSSMDVNTGLSDDLFK
ncbi:MAG: insulinase family protein [Ignavibacteriales bacterium]|nr:insulinase family protein [Ignavibacteriales bacterium]